MEASSPQGFVAEIEFSELHFIEVVGKGAFGVVSRANFRGQEVAVKLIETESEKKAFITELKQLSRVSHPNIVKLYGACTKTPVCLVMEYAEGGSLYNVLHGAGPQPAYQAAHAMSWALQCARGVEYLHGMTPKALIHRDLKPPNLLLIMGGTVLKICDFGTACDMQTHMTNNKGSAAWMAPEVFEGSNYSEKCDVFSWGIILWEVFTRRKPFDEIGGPAFRIMWAVHNGKRPPLIKNFPKPLELLMVRCWSGNPAERPSMAEVVRIMSHLFQFFKGADVPLVYPPISDMGSECGDYTYNQQLTTPTFSGSHINSPAVPESRINTLSDTVRHWQGQQVDPVAKMPPPVPCRTPTQMVVEEPSGRQQSAPPSLAASRESLHDPRGSRSSTPVDTLKRYSADLTKLDEIEIMRHGANIPPSQKGYGHRRIGSDECGRITTASSNTPTASPIPLGGLLASVPHCSTYPQLNIPMHDPPIRSVSHSPSVARNHGSHETSPPSRSISHPAQGHSSSPSAARSTSWSPEVAQPPMRLSATALPASQQCRLGEPSAFGLSHLFLDYQLQPLAPYPTHPESMSIYEKHCRLAHEYLRVQSEIALLTQRKQDLIHEYDHEAHSQQSSTHLADEYTQLTMENESLTRAYQDLKNQVEQMRLEHQRQSHNKRVGVS